MSKNTKKTAKKNVPNTLVIPRTDFEAVDFVFSALHEAFHPDGIGKDEAPSPQFLALWTLFLTTAGWTEDQYWEENETHEYTCPKCGNADVEVVPSDDDDNDGGSAACKPN